MRKCDVRTPEHALAYLADCTLATVSDLAMKKSRPKGEYRRQIAIAQSAVDWMIVMGIDTAGTRAAEIANHRGSVESWAKQYEVGCS